ncbi:MAG: type I methionyl aminopeptidase [Solirubrobacteraceae bacterium]|nr:type I methionyl aminopeptidase [Solirubrobacteraceae bacterium]
MSVKTPEELEGLRRAGRVVAETIRELRRRARPGVTTFELDAAAARIFARHGATSAPQRDYDAPCAVFLSVNDEAVHGLPGPRRLQDGDLLSIDVTVELDGFCADACETVSVGRAPKQHAQLASAARAGLARGMAAATAGAPLHAIGTAVQDEVERRGFSVCAELTGHGIGRKIHEWPTVANVFDPRATQPLTEGLVITIEPIISAGSGAVELRDDGWTISTADGAPAAHAEHTLMVTAGAPVVLTV